MSEQSHRRATRWVLMGSVAGACLIAIIVARSVLSRPQGRPSEHAEVELSQTPDTAFSNEQENGSERGVGPLSPRELNQFAWKISAQENYPGRIEARRRFLGTLRQRGPAERILPEFVELLHDVAAREGPEMAHRVAFAEAGTWQADKNYRAAIDAYQHIIDVYTSSPFRGDAMYQAGQCWLELHEYAMAQVAFQRLINEFRDSYIAGWGWRKLALAQLLQGNFDQSLATLDKMAARFGEGEFAEYARARRGYVQMIAGRRNEARTSFNQFLGLCPKSKYCRLVKEQMVQLNS